LLGSSANRRWLSGFTGSAGWVIITQERALLGTDFRYWDQAAKQAAGFEQHRLSGQPGEAIKLLVQEAGVARLAIESRHVTLEEFGLLERIPGITWQGVETSVDRLREVKQPAEIDAIRAAAAITDRVMAQVPSLVRPGMTEQELAWKLERNMREEGAERMAFPVIVASGPNAAMAHHAPGSRRLEAGDTLIVDMGAVAGGYNSDLTRSFYLGAGPAAQFERIYGIVLAAHGAGLAALAPGRTCREIDAAARQVIADEGYAEEFGHSLGHGVGLEVHEAPRLSFLNEQGLVPAGAVVTVEPGIYIRDWGGVRIEDLVLVGAEGPELLSLCPKQPYIPLD
jgi:Xaa-Pro aminopeptidase